MRCRRPHQSLAAVGVAALVRLVTAAGTAMSDKVRLSTRTVLPRASLFISPNAMEFCSFFPACRSSSCALCPHQPLTSVLSSEPETLDPESGTPLPHGPGMSA